MDNFAVSVKTLGNEPDAAIVSVAVVRFNEKKIGDKLYVMADPRDSLRHGSVTAEGIAWYLGKGDHVTEPLRGPYDKRTNLHGLLCQVKAFIDKSDNARIWGNGMTLGIAALTHAYHRAGFNMEIPWKLHQLRDANTFIGALDVSVDMLPAQPPLAGQALADAEWWAAVVQMGMAARRAPAESKASKRTRYFIDPAARMFIKATGEAPDNWQEVEKSEWEAAQKIRYWHHPESNAYLYTLAGQWLGDDIDASACVEITKEQYDDATEL